MEKSKIFLRGQVWYWEDPIYGVKSNNLVPPEGERVMRYSRYVLIVQNDDTINKYGMLVVPLSTQNHTLNDVEMSITYLTKDDKTCYAKCRAMFISHPLQMRKYICTVSDDVMKSVDDQLLKLLFPSLTGNIQSDGVINYMDAADMENVITTPGRLLVAARNDLTEKNEESFETEDEVLDSETAASAEVEDSNTPPKPIKIWTDERIEDFIRTYVIDGAEAACKKFSLKASSAYSYYKKWRKLFDLDFSLDTKDEIVPETYEEAYDIDTIHKSMSKFSNCVREYFEGENIYSTFYVGNEYNLEKTVDEEGFYKKFTSAVYFSFMEFMEIDRYSDGTLVWNGDDPDSMELAFFFTRIFHDRMMISDLSVIDILAEFRSKYNRIGLDEKWGELLSDKLRLTLNMTKEGSSSLFSLVRSKLLV